MPECAECGNDYLLDDGCEPDGLCHSCAHSIAGIIRNKMTYEPKVGHYLHASCSGEDVYEIVGSGKDENGSSTIDVRVLNLNEIIHYEDDSGWVAPLTFAELPDGVHVILRGMQWRSVGSGYADIACIEVNAPKGGCYRCSYLFSVHAAPGGRDPVKINTTT